MIVQWPDELQSYTEDGWIEESYLEYGTGHSHWTDSNVEEVDKRNPIGFIWPT